MRTVNRALELVARWRVALGGRVGYIQPTGEGMRADARFGPRSGV
jgi:hypothetical protein